MNKEYIIVHEGLAESILKDAWTYALIGLLAWFNYNYIGGSYFVNALIVFMIVGGEVSHTKRHSESIKSYEEGVAAK